MKKTVEKKLISKPSIISHEIKTGNNILLGFSGNANNDVTIYQSEHCYENRGNSKFPRNYALKPIFVEDLIEEALNQGLTQFRDKRVCLVWQGRDGYDAMVVKLDGNNDVNIISVLIGTKETDFRKPYIKSHNRIHLPNFS